MDHLVAYGFARSLCLMGPVDCSWWRLLDLGPTWFGIFHGFRIANDTTQRVRSLLGIVSCDHH
jgi:hypothetical protein